MFRNDRGRKHLNDKERAAIIAFTLDGKSIRDIANLLGIGDATVVRWQKRYSKENYVNWKAGSGRPLKTTPAEDRRLFLAVEAKPITSRDSWHSQINSLKIVFLFLNILITFLDVAQVDISPATVRRIFKKRDLDILNNVFLPSIGRRFPNTRVKFIHDNSPIHKAIIIREWLQNHPEIQVIPWPRKGADMNPIENV